MFVIRDERRKGWTYARMDADESLALSDEPEVRRAQTMRDLVVIGMYHLESLARSSDSGNVTRAAWERCIRFDLEDVPGSVGEELLERMWQSKLARRLVLAVQAETNKGAPP